MSRKTSVDLTNCDQEPIHIPGSVQPHGCLIALSETLDTVAFSSQNAGAMLFGLEGDASNLVGRRFADLFDDDPRHAIRNALARAASFRAPGLCYDCPIGGNTFDISTHKYNDWMIIEFEPSAPRSNNGTFELMRALLRRMQDVRSIDAIVDQATQLLRGMIGYDRIMIYRFLHDGAGQVIAEQRRPDLESFRNQFFPASDIPAQARELYVKNLIRVIGDAAADVVPILAAEEHSTETLDLSYAHLRGVSPIHCEYLRNMGVAASMSVSIVVEGKLWGLIACHHYSPRVLTMAQRVGAEMFGRFFSLRIETIERSEALEATNKARRQLDDLVPNLLLVKGSIDSVLRSRLPDLRGLIDCDGIGLWINDKFTGSGMTPTEDDVHVLCEFLSDTAPPGVWAKDRLSEVHAPAADYREDVSGVLAVPLSRLPSHYLLFFRREVIKTIEWGGDPNKSVITASGANGDRLTPRKSFEIWREEVVGQSRPWSAADIAMGEAARAALLEVVLRNHEIELQERETYDAQRKVLIDELNHRVKNLLALIQSIVARGVDQSQTVENYAKELEGRVRALSLAHDQISRDGSGSLETLFGAELSPYADLRGIRVTFEGPGVGLSARAFSAMALVVHELATNAAKYGALVGPTGALRIDWRIGDAGECDIYWRETQNERPIIPPSKDGFGMKLIQHIVPHDLGSTRFCAFRQSTSHTVRRELNCFFPHRRNRARSATSRDAKSCSSRTNFSSPWMSKHD
jgi:light-regulated signal transduction histidine kinase (bacteriophytochrome)